MKKDIEVLFSIITQLGKVITQQSSQSLEERNATFLQFMVLSFIKENPNCKTGDLSSNLNMSTSSATQMIERLVKLKLVKRSDDKTDRRITRVDLTTSGVK